ncbi:TniQ family protein [Streptomyces chrestomyceticus]|uniref:TniQ family protein n=1 Tax=Streptomyces chrestomyceticus TaxID=68185 RepID=UPI003404EB3B
MNSELPPRFAPLPVRLRPCLGESTNSYIRRLAHANHLQPSFLHCYLCGPPQWFGRPLLEHLATTAGHSPEALERALADANSLGGTNRPRRRLPRRNPFARRQDLAHRIAQEALKGTQIRTLAKRHNLRCSDIRFALEVPRLITAETSPLTDPITGELADLVEGMIGRKLNGRQIWTELMDHHDYLVTYDSIRHYIRYTRSRTASALAESLTSNLVGPGQGTAHDYRTGTRLRPAGTYPGQPRRK